MVLSGVGTQSVGPARALEALQVGMKAPDFALESFEGRTVALRDFSAARATLLVFWASWSEWSPEVLERVQQLHARYRDQGLAVLGINVESPRSTAAELAQAHALARRLGLTFPLLVDRGLQVFGSYGVVAVPSLVLLRGDGTVAGHLAGYPIASREEFFELVEATVTGRPVARPQAPAARQPNPRAVRYFNLARAMVARGLVDQVESDLRRAIALDPDFALPRILLAQIYRERAVAVETIQVEGGRVETLRLRADERDALLRQAERLLDEALRIDPVSAAALAELAAVRLARGELEPARRLLERALTADPSWAPARAQLGALLVRGGDIARGRGELEAALRLNPLDWRLYLLAGQAFEERGLLADALRHYRRGVEVLWAFRRDLFPLSDGK